MVLALLIAAYVVAGLLVLAFAVAVMFMPFAVHSMGGDVAASRQDIAAIRADLAAILQELKDAAVDRLINTP